MTIRELTSEADFLAMLPLVQQLNPSITLEIFHERLPQMRAQGYRCIAYVDETGTYRGLCGFWCGTRFWCGNFIDIDNFVVDEAWRSRGIGKKLLAWVEAEALRLGCQQTGLDCYTTYHEAHKLYMREGYIIRGYHFTKALS
ncbi:MAG: GNAT family N-acetyltransferase [Alphaproteobacteria bacterium]|nr:MAG: GNAT family N-acetyltransferase [Alphaproteobacteria bacterium]TAF76703.1 MAG: GNAT family N-acetyltransferase [Alphaproteobacteria bacterium]